MILELLSSHIAALNTILFTVYQQSGFFQNNPTFWIFFAYLIILSEHYKIKNTLKCILMWVCWVIQCGKNNIYIYYNIFSNFIQSKFFKTFSNGASRSLVTQYLSFFFVKSWFFKKIYFDTNHILSKYKYFFVLLTNSLIIFIKKSWVKLV